MPTDFAESLGDILGAAYAKADRLLADTIRSGAPTRFANLGDAMKRIAAALDGTGHISGFSELILGRLVVHHIARRTGVPETPFEDDTGVGSSASRVGEYVVLRDVSPHNWFARATGRDRPKRKSIDVTVFRRPPDGAPPELVAAMEIKNNPNHDSDVEGVLASFRILSRDYAPANLKFALAVLYEPGMNEKRRTMIASEPSPGNAAIQWFPGGDGRTVGDMLEWMLPLR